MWVKIVGALGAAIGVLLAIIGYKNKKINVLEDENEGFQKLEEVTQEINQAAKKAEEDEEKSKQDIDDSDWSSSI